MYGKMTRDQLRVASELFGRWMNESPGEGTPDIQDVWLSAFAVFHSAGANPHPSNLDLALTQLLTGNK